MFTHGLIFFGVPNLGLRNEQLLAIVGGQANERLIRDLMMDEDLKPSAYLDEITQKFVETCRAMEAQRSKFEIISYYERKTSSTVEVSWYSSSASPWLIKYSLAIAGRKLS